MIIDKYREDKNDAYDVALKILSLGYADSTPGKIADIIDKYVTESADQARKEAAERVACAWREHGEDITLRILREAILGDSGVKENLITDHIPDAGKKLAIAVKALEYVVSKSLPSSVFESHYSRLQDACAKASDALKEIQG